jgi:hypothetical protein
MNWAPLIGGFSALCAMLAAGWTAFLARRSDRDKASIAEITLLYEQNAKLRERDDMRSIELGDLRSELAQLRFEVQWLRAQLGQA